ncbi:MAG TPA: ABC transporter permease [Candidatus Pelethocola excrementipullorum]|nr:ABC transporter permease [Candidatus Pelethocola excrementipullorum]
MTVFKGYMKITKRNLGMVFLYFIIFYTMAVAMQNTYESQELDNFSAVKIDMAVVDEDQGELAQLLESYLNEIHNVKAYSDEDSLQEEMFYSNIEYIVRIPKDLEKKVILGGETVTVTAKPGSYTSFYVDQQINSFLNSLRTYKAAGFSDVEIKEIIHSGDEAELNLVDFGGRGGVEPQHSFMFRFLPYIMIAALSYVLSYILSAFNNPDTRNRMRASAISQRRQMLESFLAFCVIGLCFWCLCMGFSVLVYGKAFLEDSLLVYYLINSLVLMVVALSIAFLIGLLVKGNAAINGVVNVISLGMSFVCGVFVPLAALGSSVKKIAQFMPVYWYEIINDMLAKSGKLSETMKVTIYKGYGIQLLFAAACICTALAVGRLKSQE